MLTERQNQIMVPIRPTRMSAECRRRVLEPSEGLRLVAYRDCVGVLIIGYGHTSAAGAPQVKAGMTISAEEADAILIRDLATTEAAVSKLLANVKRPVFQHEFDALVDLAFNIGVGAFAGSSLLKAYLAGDVTLAARKFLDWNKAGGRAVAGLTARRRRDRDWFLTGKVEATPLTFADMQPADMAHGLFNSPDLPDIDGELGSGATLGALLWAAGLTVGLGFCVYMALVR